MTARVHFDLLLSEDGRRTAAELTHRLKISPASVSVRSPEAAIAEPFMASTIADRSDTGPSPC